MVLSGPWPLGFLLDLAGQLRQLLLFPLEDRSVLGDRLHLVDLQRQSILQGLLFPQDQSVQPDLLTLCQLLWVLAGQSVLEDL